MQIIIQEEIGIIKVIDFWGGFYMMEFLIQEIVDKVWVIIEDIQEKGGMVKVIEKGEFKLWIEEVVVCK